MNANQKVAVVTAAIAAFLLPMQPSAQTVWPTRPIKLIVPFAPGGSNDNIARVLAGKLGAQLGQSVIVDNKPGGGGTIGTDFVAKSALDGHTILLASSSITTNAASGKKLPYDPVKDLQAIGEVGVGAYVIAVANDLKGVTTLREFIDLARAKPNSISYGSAGVGGLNHLGTELLASAAGIQLVHVPYKGIGPAFTDMMGGNLQMALPSIASAMPFIQSGKIRGLAVTSPQRSPLAPDLPTTAEAGLPAFQLEVWWGVLGPAQMPPAVVKRLNEELNAALALPDVREVLSREGVTPKPGTAEDLGSLVRTDLVRWTRLIKDKNIQMD